MTPRYRTAFSVPSGFSAATPVAPSKASASVTSLKVRKTDLSARQQSKAARDLRHDTARKSVAA